MRAGLVTLALCASIARGEEDGKEDVAGVLRALGSENAAERLGAVKKLAALRTRAVPQLPRLLETLRDPDARVRRAAAHALVTIDPGVHEAVPVLAAVLEDKNWHTRWRAAMAIGQVGPRARRAVPALIACLKDGVLAVREQAIVALGEIGDERAVPALRARLGSDMWQERLAAALALARIGPDAKGAAKHLVRTLPGANAYEREAVVQAIAAIGTPAIREAQDARNAMSFAGAAHERMKAGRVYGLMKREEAKEAAALMSDAPEKAGRWSMRAEMAVGVNYLRAVLRHKDASFRANAALGLGGWKNAGPAPVLDLRAALNDPVSHVRQHAAVALGRAGWSVEGNDEALAARLRDPSAAVRAAAVRALGRRAGAHLLARMLRDEVAWVRVQAARALGALGKDAPPPAVRALEDARAATEPLVRAEVRIALARIRGELPNDD